MREFLIYILLTLPFVLVCWLCSKVNISRRYRARQVWMPLIALSFCIVAIIGKDYFFENFYVWLEKEKAIQEAARAQELMADEEFASKFTGVDVTLYFGHIESLVINTTLIAAFFIIKCFSLVWMNFHGGKDSVSQQVYMRFYTLDPTVKYQVRKIEETDKQKKKKESRLWTFIKKLLKIQDKPKKKNKSEEDDAEVWVIKKSYKQFTFFYRGFYIALFIISYILFVLFIYNEKLDWDIFYAAFYPVYGIIILGEVVFILSGLEEPDVDAQPLESKPAAVVPQSQFDIRKDYHKLYGNRILKDDLNDSFKEEEVVEPLPLESHGCEEMLRQLKESDNLDDQAVAGYFNAVEGDLDENYLSCSRELIHGHSVVVYTPFYQDLTHYLMLPVIRQLLRFRKCLVVVGRESAVDDVKSWFEKAIFEIIDTDSFWNVDILNEMGTVADIGILRFSDIYRLDIQRGNREFLKQVGFVLLLEPSRILATGQMGLSLLIGQCGKEDNDIVFCACDRNCDGLVDVLSHTLKASFTEVMATPANTAFHNLHVYWNADGDYLHHQILPEISHYLGVGTEIAAVAWKHHISPVKWFSCDKFPVVDMKWIAGQYFKAICQYAGLPISQTALNQAFQVDPNLWNGTRKNKLFYIVEDEFRNLFEMTRIYSSRATGEGFVNILSEHYLLRDYMVDNVELFVTDPKAIPAIVPDYARTERNTILKLIMLMTTGKVARSYIEKELSLCGIVTSNVENTLNQLIKRHCGIRSDESFSVLLSEESLEDGIKNHIVPYYEIRQTDPLYTYAERLKAAYYISEDEHGDKYYIGAKLYGHVYQSFLPGQFITNSGKYYQIQQISSESGVIVRRAADHLTQREYYRQVRHIEIDHWVADEHIGSQRTSGYLEVYRGYADILIQTRGYLQMHSPSDFEHAQLIDINQIPERRYLNKQILRLKLIGTTEAVRYTICLLLNEIFATIYPEASAYIFAITPVSSEMEIPGLLKYAIYDFAGECEDECIYIVEDSEIDLGLVVSAERYIHRFLEIICEVLSWHVEKMNEPPVPKKSDEPEPEPEPEPEAEPEPESPGLFKRIIQFFKDLFNSAKGPDVSEAVELPPEKPQMPAKFVELEPTEYQKHCFLKFGGSEVPDHLAIDETISWLTSNGYDHNPLQMVRCKNKDKEKQSDNVKK